MSISPAEFVDVAQSLQPRPDEASMRTSLGRCYYGAYHACLQWHAKLPEPGMLGVGAPTGSHEQLVLQLRNPGKAVLAEERSNSRTLSTLLAIMKTRRHVADYELGQSIDPAEVANQLAIAQRVLTKV